jgi:hypothetical protein
MIHQVLIYKSLYWIFKIVLLTIYHSQVLLMMMDLKTKLRAENVIIFLIIVIFVKGLFFVDDSDDFDISEILNYYESNEPNLSNHFQQYLLSFFFYYILLS